MSDWVDQHDLKPRQSNGKLYNMHSVPVLQVLARKWLENTGGPKTQNFVKNLLGTGHGATYDVWADRTLRRIGYSGHQARWRILPKNAVGVSDADFHFGQKVFAKAAKELGVRPDSLQGGLWFAEKQLWADNGWGRLDLGDFRKEIQNRELLNKGIAQRLATTEAAATAPKAEQGGFDLGDTAQYSPSMNEITKALGDIGELPGYAYRQLMDRARDNHRFGPDAGKYPDELNRGLALQYIAEQKARAPIIESRPLR
jgi:hypothetical protein